ncbi:hypothetical protein AURDEDRAFT_176852 [Auricularia subglabra TFB-10046 SS5]|uniref:Uncharacterized protein n=1 Tax=Auricularia subglabra (strain TFB-10046 / SS5) TaxID=717982 RepID=J0WNX7_AURST|nr:hypothetical protein AURDEDRAFT_176852 [Auricularia subglabra TFB-10046 SS5]
MRCIIPAAGEADSLSNSRARPSAASSHPTSPLTTHLRPAIPWLPPGALGALRHRRGLVVTTGHSPPATRRRLANPARCSNDNATPRSTIPAPGDVDSLSRARPFAVGGELEPDQRAQGASPPRCSLAPPCRLERVQPGGLVVLVLETGHTLQRSVLVPRPPRPPAAAEPFLALPYSSPAMRLPHSSRWNMTSPASSPPPTSLCWVFLATAHRLEQPSDVPPHPHVRRSDQTSFLAAFPAADLLDFL